MHEAKIASAPERRGEHRGSPAGGSPMEATLFLDELLSLT